MKLELLGRRFTVRSDDDDEYIQELTSYINEKLSTVRRATGRVEADQIALLALLDVTDELFRTRVALDEANDKIDDLRGSLRDRAKALLGAIDRMAEKIGADEKALAEVPAEATVKASG